MRGLSPAYRFKPIGALTLIEVMLSLCIIGLGIIAGVELMAKIVDAQNQQTSASRWESRLMKARARVEAADAQTLRGEVADGKILAYDDLAVSVKMAEANPYPGAALALVIRIQDPSGQILAEVPMLKRMP